MSITTTVKKAVTEQAYATIGATDLAVEQVRDANARLTAISAELAPAKVQARVTAAPADARAFVDDVTTRTQKGYAELVDDVQKGYADLTVRGEKLVTRIRNQASTKELISQAESTLALGKGAVTSVRKAVSDVERSAKATLTTSRKEAEKAADAIVDSVTVEVDTDKAEKAVADSVKRTRTAAKRTSTTAKNASKKSTAATKRATTSARKTTTSARKATKKAAEKVGD